jgi:ribosome maturation factor RimP
MAQRTASATATETRVRALTEPLLADLGVELDDVQWGGGRLRVVVDAAGGIDSETLVLVSRTISAELDAADPIPSRYTLEVTSPGVERPLRRPDHYRKAIGSQIAVKLHPGVDGDRRLEGRLVAADDERISLETGGGTRTEIRLESVSRARTVFDWGRPGAGGNGRKPAGDSLTRGGSAE